MLFDEVDQRSRVEADRVAREGVLSIPRCPLTVYVLLGILTLPNLLPKTAEFHHARSTLRVRRVLRKFLNETELFVAG